MRGTCGIFNGVPLESVALLVLISHQEIVTLFTQGSTVQYGYNTTMNIYMVRLYEETPKNQNQNQNQLHEPIS